MSDDLMDLIMGEDAPKDYKILKPPYPWPGNKYKSVERILDILPKSKIYVEPFGGSAAVLLSKEPSMNEVYNDRFTGVVDFYRCLRDPERYRELIEVLDIMEFSRESFMECKRTWEQCGDLVQRAARWYYTICTSFNGLGRNFGRVKGANTPVARRIEKNIRYFPEIHQRLRGVQIENCSYQSLFEDFDSPDTVFYVDPPYLFTDPGVYPGKWVEADQLELLQYIFQCEGYVALSGYDNSLTNSFPWDDVFEWDLIAGMDVVTDNNRNKKCTKSTATEKLWIKEAN